MTSESSSLDCTPDCKPGHLAKALSKNTQLLLYGTQLVIYVPLKQITPSVMHVAVPGLKSKGWSARVSALECTRGFNAEVAPY